MEFFAYIGMTSLFVWTLMFIQKIVVTWYGVKEEREQLEQSRVNEIKKLQKDLFLLKGDIHNVDDKQNDSRIELCKHFLKLKRHVDEVNCKLSGEVYSSSKTIKDLKESLINLEGSFLRAGFSISEYEVKTND